MIKWKVKFFLAPPPPPPPLPPRYTTLEENNQKDLKIEKAWSIDLRKRITWSTFLCENFSLLSK